MENSKPFIIDAKKTFMGGLIAIILSPISIILAFYLGQQLDKPKLSVTNTEQIFASLSPGGTDSLSIPDSISNPLKVNPEISIYSDIESEDFTNIMSKEDASDLVSSLKDANLKYDFFLKMLTTDITKITSWDGKSELILEPISPSLLGGKSLYSLVKEDRNGALNILRGISSTAENRKKDINRFIEFVSPFIDNKTEKHRTGEIVLKVGILNSGKTDAVVFPNADLKFKGNTIYYSSKNKYNSSGYTVITAHSFKQITYTLNSNEGNTKDIEEWEAMVKNHTTEDFTFTIKSIESDISYTTHLEAK